MDWQSNVYGKKELPDDKKSWDKLRKLIIKRDHQTCLRCDKRGRIRDLTVHHVIPRSEGGLDVLSNLITLCAKCHDYVELNDLRNRASIIGSYDSTIIETKTINQAEEERPDWHTWVYGGCKNPFINGRSTNAP
jgi:hypothetical protein